MAEGTSYTFNAWDNHSAILDPTTKAVTQTMGSIPLLIQHHAIKLMQIIKSQGGAVICNGQPLTRTVREWAAQGQKAGGRGGANLHFIENSESEARRMHTHLFTPISLTRYGGDLYDLDPLYNNTCAVGRDAFYGGHGQGLGGSFKLSPCVGANIADHLDYGVVSFLYDGMFYNKTTPTILSEMFPITPHRIGEGIVVGTERIITKISGKYSLANLKADAPLIVFTYKNGFLGSRICCGAGIVRVVLAHGEVAIIREATHTEVQDAQ
jgi:hypothetical protein